MCCHNGCLQNTGAHDEHAESQARDLLIQIVAILTTMVKNLTEENQGEGKGKGKGEGDNP